MTRKEVRDKIEAITQKRYHNYEGEMFTQLKKQHILIRNSMGDRGFLKFLETLEKETPTKIYPS